MSPAGRRTIDYRELIRKVENAVAAVQETEDLGKMVRTLVETAIREFRTELGIWGGRLYQRDGRRHFVLLAVFADAKPLSPGFRLPRSYPPIQQCVRDGVVYIEPDDPTFDPEIEKELGVREFACIEVGSGQYILAFNVAPGFDREDILYSLGILRHSINQRVRHERLQEVFREARRIHQSILPRQQPSFSAFDIYCRSEPLESVGGDYYDYIDITDKSLGIVVADATGHGLPAALQVRDIYTGLRMGLSRDFKIVHTVERLNQIIHRSTLTSRFVSMVYGELEPNGNFIYVNAGHPPAFWLRSDGRREALSDGGPVLGPLPEATYARGFCRLRLGDILALYSDGIVESLGWPETSAVHGDTAQLEEYGQERLLRVVEENRDRSAREIVEAVLDHLAIFCKGQEKADDQTLMIVRFLGNEAS